MTRSAFDARTSSAEPAPGGAPPPLPDDPPSVDVPRGAAGPRPAGPGSALPPGSADGARPRVSWRTLARWAREGTSFACLTAYDATTARWLERGGVPVLLTATVIMLCSATFAWAGLHLGAMGRRHFEAPAEAVSGVLLLAVAGMIALGWL